MLSAENKKRVDVVDVCGYCGRKAEYRCKIKTKYLCENCKESHLHNIQEYILEVMPG